MLTRGGMAGAGAGLLLALLCLRRMLLRAALVRVCSRF